MAAAIQCGPAVAADPNNPPQRNDGGTDYTARGPSAPVIIKIEPSAEEVEAVAEKESAKRRIGGLEPDAWIALFNLVLGASTILLWLETKRLARGAEQQGKDFKASIFQATRAAAAMEGVSESMAANVASANTITDRQKLQLRAYVFPNTGNLYSGLSLVPPQPKRANDPFIGLEIRNSGPTPAYKINSWAGIAIIEPNREETLVVPPMVDTNKFTLGAYQSGPKNMWFGRALTQSEINDVKAGAKRIYYYGRVEYVTLGEAHFTNFRLHYSGDFPTKIAAGLIYADKGNDAD